MVTGKSNLILQVYCKDTQANPRAWEQRKYHMKIWLWCLKKKLTFILWRFYKLLYFKKVMSVMLYILRRLLHRTLIIDIVGQESFYCVLDMPLRYSDVWHFLSPPPSLMLAASKSYAFPLVHMEQHDLSFITKVCAFKYCVAECLNEYLISFSQNGY